MIAWTALWASPAFAPLKGLGGIVKSVLTGPDNKSWAPGRIMGFATFIIAQCLVVRVSAALLPVLHSPERWMTFFAAVAAFQGATGATCIALVLGMAPTDAGGRWWSKDARPPPAP
jgi:hypothetical protein